jgi:PhnB protein
MAPTDTPAPTMRTGKICYLEMPALDVKQSATFYERVFGWNIRDRGTGRPSFDDTTGAVSGAWVLDRTPDSNPGILPYVMVADAARAAEAVVAEGGSIVLPAGRYGTEILATFLDPAGNLLGIYQQPGLEQLETRSRDDRPAPSPQRPVQTELTVRRGRAAIEFYGAAFGAVEIYRFGGTDDHEEVVAQLAVGDTTFWVEDESPPHHNFSPESLGGATTRTLLVVDDPDTVVRTALAAGATEVIPVAEEHGWRLGRIRDPFGHHWEVGRPLGAWPPGDSAGPDHGDPTA